MIRYQKTIVLLLIVSLSGLASLAIDAGKQGDPQMSVSYQLLVESKVSIHAETINCRLRAENKTDKLQFVSRPMEKDISLYVEGFDKGRYSIVFEEREFESLATRQIPLRPECAIEMKLAKIMLNKPTEGESAIPIGSYSVTASWKRTGLPHVQAGNFQAIEKYLPPPTSLQTNKDEYPLAMILEPSSRIYYQGERVLANVRLENNGLLPITLLNHFHPYMNHFRLEKKYAASGTRIEEPVHGIEKITPHQIEGWITLLPGESLVVAIDVSNDFKTPGEYLVGVTYQHGPIILYATNGKPYYTNQRTWTSRDVDIVISNVPKPNIRKEDQAKNQ